MRPIALAATLLLTTAAAALAEPRFATTAELLDAVRAGRIDEGTRVTLTRVTITTQPVENSYGGANEYTTWFYVNDRGRDGDGVLVALPNYWTSGADPFDEDSEDPYESEITIPTLKRGYEIEVSGRITTRSDGKGWMLERPLDDHDTYLDFVVEGSGDDETHDIRTRLTVHSAIEAPAPPRPSNVRVTPGAGVAPGDLIVVTGRNLGDRARLLFDGRPLEVTSRRPGALVAVVPATATPGSHRLRVTNPEVTGPSNQATLTVVAAAAPAAPVLERVDRAGGLLVVRGRNLRAPTSFEARVGNRKLSVVDRTPTLLVLEAPEGLTGSLVVKVDGVASNALPLPAPTVGLAGSVPGQ